MGAFSRFIAHLYTLFLVFFTVLFLELVILLRSLAGTFTHATTTATATAADDHPMTTAQYLKLIEEKNPAGKYTSTGGVEPKECSVCLCVYEDGDEIRRLKCKHVFHKSCVDTWLEQDRATCPICRRMVVPGRRRRVEVVEGQVEQRRRRREFYGGSDEELILLLTSLHGNYMRRFM